MPLAQLRYVFGRLNLIPVQLDVFKKRDLLARAFSPSTTMRRGKFNWAFYQVEEFATEFGPFFHAFLTKYRPEIEEEVVVPETRTFDATFVKNRLVAKSRFYLHVKSGLIGYHPDSPDITRAAFKKNFKELFEEALGNFFVDAEIMDIDERESILVAIRQFENLHRLSIYLHPSNPDNTPLWDGLDKDIKELNAKAVSEKYYGDVSTGGLQVFKDQRVVAQLHMAEDGYGEARATGQRDGEITTVSTKSSPVMTLAGKDEEPTEKVFGELVPAIRSIVQRFKDDIATSG